MFKNKLSLNEYFLTIGIEMHCTLNTQTKMFSNAPNNFSQEPNKNISPIDLGAPGAIPVVNKKAVQLGIRAGLMFGMEINPILRFDRKNYFYTDLPKGYQITQYYEPLCINGNFMGVKIDKLFLEEDTAKQIHKGKITMIDYNRCGAPLIEMVTAPFQLKTSELLNFIEALIAKLKDFEITKGNLHEGNIRFDINLSLSKLKTELSNYKVEIKNLNSLKNIELAIDYEIKRQSHLLDNNETIISETRRFDEKICKTISMRKKLTMHDYKFFSEPVILPIYLKAMIEEEKKVFKRYETTIAILQKIKNLDKASWIKNILTNQYRIDTDAFCQSYEQYLNFLINIDQKYFFNNPKNATNVATVQTKFEQYYLKIKLEINESLDNFFRVWEKQLIIVDESIEYAKIIDDLIKNNPHIINEFQINPNKIQKFLMGNIFKITKGKADPQQANSWIIKKMQKN